MANPHIAEWSPDQVADWLTGLGPTVGRYVPGLRAKAVDGAKLLTLRCDDLEYLGVHIIGHQELILEAVEHLRNFQYEIRRECVQQLALRVAVAGHNLRAHSPLERRLETQALADVARIVHAVKPLVCWLDRWALFGGSGLAERRALLLKLSLEAATSAQRDRFAEQPARAVALAAQAITQAAEYILQDVSDHMILIPASLDTVTLQQGNRPLGFDVVPSFCGHRQLADIRFGSPAHRAGTIHEGDEIVQVGDRVVVGWSGEAVLRECTLSAARNNGDLTLRLRRRGARGAGGAAPLSTPTFRGRGIRDWGRAPRRFPHNYNYVPPWEYNDLRSFKREFGLLPPTSEPAAEAPSPRTEAETATETAASSSDESEPLSPPASPTQALSNTRMYPPRPRSAARRRHSVSSGSPLAKRAHPALEQFWQELKNQKWLTHSGSAHIDTDTTAHDNDTTSALYRRDKAISYSTGLEMSPRPNTCLGVSRDHPILNKFKTQNAKLLMDDEHSPSFSPKSDKNRGKLDKSHSTPAYDFGMSITDEPSSLVTQIIPESPTSPTDSPTILVHSAEKADQILDFKKSSSQIGEAILQQQSKRGTNGEETSKFPFDEKDAEEDSKVDKLLETINIAMIEHQNKENRTRHSTLKSQTSDESGHSMKSFSVTEHTRTIQNEIVQAINDQRSTSTAKYSKPLNISEVPPEPPPRPAVTQRTILKEPPLPAKETKPKEYPVLKPVKPIEVSEPTHSPLKPFKHGEILQISLPLKHITKHDIHMIPNDRRELPALNSETNLNVSQSDISKIGRKEEGTVSPGLSQSQSLQRLECSSAVTSPARAATLSPTASVVRGIFPSSKSKNLKKKNSILAKGRSVPARTASAWAGAAGAVRQRVRREGAARWATRHLMLLDTALLAYRTPECGRADCVIYLDGFTCSAAPEVKSQAHTFKVYHTGTVFYFAAPTREQMCAWIQHIHRATLAPRRNTTEDSKQFSETDYSENESDTDSPDKRTEHRGNERDKEKDKSKFGSLKKLTHRMQRSESQEHVAHAATSLDRKYLRFFSRAKNKDEVKTSKKQTPVTPVPTEHYRSYRRVVAAPPASPPADISPSPSHLQTDPEPPSRSNSKKLPKPINYIHASNPNLLDFEKSDFVAKPIIAPPPRAPHKTDNFVGFVTLEQFMLKKQEEERQQVYTNRVLMGIERDRKEDRGNKKAAKDLKKRLDKIVPDVIYGELPPLADELPLPVLEIQSRTLPDTPPAPARSQDAMKPVSVKGKDGYEKIVYTSDKTDEPPKIYPRKLRQSPDVMRKNSLSSAKDLGYELIYDDEVTTKRRDSDVSRALSRNVSTTSRDSDSADKKSVKEKPVPPPKIMPKSVHVLHRQTSLSTPATTTTNRHSGVDTSPVFVQGESPEKFWLNSLRRNDKVHGSAAASSTPPAPLKSARQYIPVALPGAALSPARPKTRDRDPGSSSETPPAPLSASPSGMSRLRQMFSPRRGSSGGGGGNSGTTPALHQDSPPLPRDSEDDIWALRLNRPEASPQYPHLQCPPTFEPETYSLAARITHRDETL